MADGSVPIVLSPEPFARTTTYVEAPAGCTVRTMLTSAVARGHLKLDDLARTNVYVDGVRLDREDALTMVLREGQVINVVLEPLGGGSGRLQSPSSQARYSASSGSHSSWPGWVGSGISTASERCGAR